MAVGAREHFVPAARVGRREEESGATAVSCDGRVCRQEQQGPAMAWSFFISSGEEQALHHASSLPHGFTAELGDSHQEPQQHLGQRVQIKLPATAKSSQVLKKGTERGWLWKLRCVSSQRLQL